MSGGRPWTDAERLMVRQWVEAGRGRGWTVKQSCTAVAKMLAPRTARAIQQEAYRLGIAQRLPAPEPKPRRSQAGKERKPQQVIRPGPAIRACLTCRHSFTPEDRFDFVCDGCERSRAWRYGAALA